MAPHKQLCTKVPVLISVVGRTHRFAMMLRTSVAAATLLRDDQFHNFHAVSICYFLEKLKELEIGVIKEKSGKYFW